MIQPQVISSSTREPSTRPATGFTITELLIVIAIIVLVLAMAVPAFNAITGNKSEAAMMNTISAMLARARTEAVGVQQMRGIMFYYDPNDGNTKVALVRQVDPPTPNSSAITPRFPMQNIDVYLDLTSDRDVLTLPAGIGVQTIDDNSGAIYDDRYIGYNTKARHPGGTVADTDFSYGGVILFDGRGQLVCKSYAFQTQRNNVWTAMGTLLWTNTINPATDIPDPLHDDIAPVDPVQVYGGRPLYLRSQIGIAVYSEELFSGQGSFTRDDAQVRAPGNPDSAEQAEEQWIDEHATLAMINRYNGSLLKGE
jgi:type II secretory pathway pseudopilin PulG